MLDKIIKLYIKNSEDTGNPIVRQKYGVLSGMIGISCNILLFIIKFTAGIITSSISISADAFNNLSDAGSSIVTLIGFKMSGKPADLDHPFGHGRIEYLSGFLVSFAIIIMGYELFKSSIHKVFHPEHIQYSIISVIILIISIIIKMWMAFFYKNIGKKINSAAMGATATDSLSDCVTTTVVLIASLISFGTGVDIDGYTGVLVAFFVLYAGITTAKETLQPLLGQPAEKELVDSIIHMVTAHEEIIGVHDLIVHDYGPGRIFATLHAEIPYNMDIMQAHDVIDLAEKEVLEQLNCEISIHMDPVVTDDETVTWLKNMTESILKDIDPIIKMHDFRITEGPYITNIIFDIEIPYDYIMADEDIKSLIINKITEQKENCNVIINIDKCFVG